MDHYTMYTIKLSSQEKKLVNVKRIDIEKKTSWKQRIIELQFLNQMKN